MKTFIKERECLAQLYTSEMNYFVHCDQTIKIQFFVIFSIFFSQLPQIKIKKQNSIELTKPK